MIGSFYPRTLPYSPRSGPSIRLLLAGVLRAASRSLAHLSRSLSASKRARSSPHDEAVYEFYAHAGAPEGALYVNGELVGYLPGVNRL